MWVQEDGEVETNIWEHERSETIIFKGHNSEAITKFSIYRSIILSTFLRQHNYTLFLLFHNSVLFSVSFFYRCGSTTYWQEITCLFPKESVGSSEQALWAGRADFPEE